jgi:hypothetical protein
MPGAINKITHQEANLLRALMVKGLRDQAPGGKRIKPVSAMTRMLRGLPKSKKIKKAATHKAKFIGPIREGERRGNKRRKVTRVKLGSSKALIVTGDLMRSIHTKKHARSNYTVGVHRGTRGTKSGKDMRNIAAIHEGGTRKYTVTVTEKMRRFSMFLFMMGVILAPWKVGQKLKRQIPARPFLEPAHDLWESAVAFRFHKKLEMLMDRF